MHHRLLSSMQNCRTLARRSKEADNDSTWEIIQQAVPTQPWFWEHQVDQGQQGSLGPAEERPPGCWDCLESLQSCGYLGAYGKKFSELRRTWRDGEPSAHRLDLVSHIL